MLLYTTVSSSFSFQTKLAGISPLFRRCNKSDPRYKMAYQVKILLTVKRLSQLMHTMKKLW